MPDLAVLRTGWAAGGTATFSGNGSTTTFNIAHGLPTIPEVYFADPKTTDARGNINRTVDATNITIVYPIAPPSGSSNIVFTWGAGYIAEAIQGFTPGSVTILFNKIIGDRLTFQKVITPTNPPLEEGVLYLKQIDANNNGWFSIIKKNGVLMEVQIK